MKKYSIGIIALLILIALVWQAGVFDNKQVGKEEKIRVGVIAPLSGVVADYGEEMRKGILAADALNLEFVFEDDKCEPKDAVSAYKKLVEVDKVNIIIGPGCGSPQEAIIPLLKDQEVTVLVPSAASRDLYEQSHGKFFNVQYALEDESKFLAEKMYERGEKKVVLISYQNAFSEIHVKSFKEHYKGEIIREISFATDKTDVSTELAKLKGLDFDAIFSTDVTFFFAQGVEKLKLYGITKPVYSQYVTELPAIRSLVDGVIYSFPSNLEESNGAVVNALSRHAAELTSRIVKTCGNDSQCFREQLMKSGEFDASGVSVRSLILKKIEDGIPQTLQ